jgi:transcriptional regulator GlxA family with amidase domain
MLRTAFVVSPGFQMMSFAAMSVFEMANYTAGEVLYDIRLLSESGGAVPSSLGMPIETERFHKQAFDTLIVGGLLAPLPSSNGLLSFLRRALPVTRRIASICTGALVLAEAGLLDGRRATTHWLVARELQARFPKVRMEEDRIFIVDGPIWTSAGMTAGIDLVLAMIDSDLGPEVAKVVAKLMVISQRRLGGQNQHSALLDMTPKSDRIELVLTHIRQNLRNPLSVEELAAVARLSPRQFSRAFLAETGQSPAKAVERLRLERARFMVEEGRHSVKVVAQETGFADRERMRRAFLRTFGVPAEALRRNARQGAVAVA